jgi:alanyl-tRNA synthetase
MCEITNNQSEELLKSMRLIDKEGTKDLSNEVLAKTYAMIYKFQKEMEGYEKLLKEVLTERKIDKTEFEELGVKVFMKELNEKTEYDVEAIADKLAPADFKKIVNIVKGKIDTMPNKEEINKVIAQHISSVKLAESVASVAKMTKAELMEHKK